MAVCTVYELGARGGGGSGAKEEEEKKKKRTLPVGFVRFDITTFKKK